MAADSPWADVLNNAVIASRAAGPAVNMPGVIAGAAQSQDPVGAAQAAASFRWGVDTTDRLRQMAPEQARSTWTTLTPQEQKLLEAVGYKLPALQESWWKKTLLAGPRAAKKGFSSGLHVLGAPIRAVSHAYRAVTSMEIEGERESGSQWSFHTIGKIFSPEEWSQHWEATSDGESWVPFARESLEEGESKLPAEYWDLAIDQAKGQSLEALIGRYGADRVAEAQQHPEWGMAVQLADAGKVSFGRRVAGQLGLGPADHSKGPLRKSRQAAYRTLSGTLDAVFNIYADPIFGAPATALKGARAAKIAIASAEDWRRVSQFPKFRRGLEQVARGYELGGTGRVTSEFPKLMPVAQRLDDFAKSLGRPLDADGVSEFFEGYAGLGAVLQGQAPRALGILSPDDFPSLGLLGRPGKAIKRGVHAGFEKLEELPSLQLPKTKAELNLFKSAGKFARGMTQLYAKQRSFDPMSDQAVEVVRQIGALSLPRHVVEDYVTAWTAADMGGKFNVYKSMIDDVFVRLGSDYSAASGAKPVTALGSYHQELLSQFDEDITGAIYSWNTAGDITSNVARDGASPVAMGVYRYQIMRPEWDLPNLRRIAEAKYAETLMGRMAGKAPLIDGFPSVIMEKWRPAVVLRFSFGIRNAGEEVFRHILDKGFLPTMRSRMASSAIKGQQRLAEKAAGEARTGVRNFVADRAARVFAPMQARIAGKEYVQAADELLERFGPRLLPQPVQAAFKGHMDLAEVTRKNLRSWRGRPLPVTMKPTGNYKGLGNLDPGFAERWAVELAPRMEEETFRAALANIDDYDRAVDAVKGVLQADEYASVRSFSGRTRAAPEAEAVNDWARVVVEDVLAHTHSPDGTPLRAVIDTLKAGEKPSVELLEAIPRHLRPHYVAAPETLPVPRDWFAQVVDTGFERFIDPQVDYISRQPIFVHEYVMARKTLRTQVKKLEAAGVSNADELAQEWAVNVAQRNAIGQVDNPLLRNQFQQMHSSILPFWHAQEQFLKRWGRTLVRNPQAFRKAQLLMMGMRHTGIVQKDENGDDVFAYPAWGFSQAALTKTAGLLFGDMSLPIAVPFTGKIKYMAPGIDRTLMPGVGPFVAASITTARKLWPEFTPLRKAEEAVLGPGAGDPIWQQFVPGYLRNVYHAWQGAPDQDQQLMSAMNGAQLMLEHAGHGLPEDATPAEREIYIDRVRKWARATLVMRAAFGFFAPTTPKVDFDAIDKFSPELKKLMSILPADQAFAEFARRNPDADAFTVFQSESIQGGVKPLPATLEAGRWLEGNRGFVNKHRAAATWFVPDAPSEFDVGVWSEELAMGLRRRKTPDEFWEDLKIGADSDRYYRSKERFDAELAKAQSSEQRQALRASWGAWKDAYLQTRPLFARHLSQGGTRAVDREAQINAVEGALVDPEAPTTPHSAALGQMIRSYRSYRAAMFNLKGREDSYSSQLRKNLTLSFSQWAVGQEDAVAKRLYEQLIKWQLDQTALAGSVEGAA